MGAQAIDNANLVNLNVNLGTTGFTPAVSYAYDAGAKTVTVTDGSTIPAGDTLKKVHVKVMDDFGGEVRDTITVTGAPGAKTINVATLDPSNGLKVMATVLTTKMLAADGSAVRIGAAGSVGRWDAQANA